MANITVTETTDGLTATTTITMPKTDAITEQIKWLENKANINQDLAEKNLSFFDTNAFLRYSLEASRYQTIADWLKEYREILQEREGKQQCK